MTRAHVGLSTSRQLTPNESKWNKSAPFPAARPSGAIVPRLIADAGERASLRFLDFFTANICNPNTRAAYAVAVRAFFAWLDSKHVCTRGDAHASRLRLRRGSEPPQSRADRQTAPRRDPHAVRLVDRSTKFSPAPIRPPRYAGRNTSSRKARPPCSTTTKRRRCSTASTFRSCSACATGR
jgi:hypothetical protein